MKLAISNIAWLPGETEIVAKLLFDLGVRHIEIAPTTIDPNPLSLSSGDLLRYRKYWEEKGFSIVALQALLYGREDLTIFESSEKREKTVDYLTGIMDLASLLGAEVLVFGSPRNRRVGDLPADESLMIEQEFFGRIGTLAAARKLMFCIEPNPELYGCDYLNTSVDVMSLLQRIGSPGLGLHLDAAGMILSSEDPGAIETLDPSRIAHFHISEPQLALIGGGAVPHERFGDALRAIGYDRFVSIEMRADREPAGANLMRVRSAVEYAIDAYGLS